MASEVYDCLARLDCGLAEVHSVKSVEPLNEIGWAILNKRPIVVHKCVHTCVQGVQNRPCGGKFACGVIVEIVSAATADGALVEVVFEVGKGH
jgi:hypothetical protein